MSKIGLDNRLTKSLRIAIALLFESTTENDEFGGNEAYVGSSEAQQITENGGSVALESTGGKILFFAKHMVASPLFARFLLPAPTRCSSKTSADRHIMVEL